ncbi:MAG TPA: amidohydrolase [Blastocatellia bacterium]|nr:amidohydrolase [Blastocatellia bacterium]
MQIVDTHQHLWDLDKLPYSWTANQPKLNRSFRMSDYLEATQGIDVVKSVFVEADIDEAFIPDETRYVLESSERDDNPLSGVVASARPEYDNFRESIREFVTHPNFKGIRRLLQSEPDELSTTTTFRENIRSLAEHGLSFDICIRDHQLPVAIELIKACPEVSFILDHCGNPDIKNRNYDVWRERIAEIASLPNVAIKVSGIVVNTDIENWTVEDLRLSVEHVIASFGWDRVMFGSDWPVCTLAASYRQWFDALNFLVKDSSEENRRKLFKENAERVYRLS